MRKCLAEGYDYASIYGNVLILQCISNTRIAKLLFVYGIRPMFVIYSAKEIELLKIPLSIFFSKIKPFQPASQGSIT